MDALTRQYADDIGAKTGSFLVRLSKPILKFGRRKRVFKAHVA
jgi:hypothetical protein